MSLVRHLYISIHHEVKGLTKGTPFIHPPLGSGASCHINLGRLWCKLSYEFEACLMWGEMSVIHHDTVYK